MEKFYKIDNNGYAEIELDKDIYNLVTIEKSLANFMEKIYIKLEEKRNRILIKIKTKNKEENLEKLIGELYNDFLRENLRYNIAMETKNLRELIVGRALYTTCIDMKEEETEEMNLKENEEKNYNIDEIAVNWFEENKDIEDKLC